jgi:hypothetical protein
VRTWVGTSRGDNGKTRVTLVWEPIPKTPGDVVSARSEPASRVSVMAVGSDGSPYYRGKVEGTPASGAMPAKGGMVSFEVNPGKVQVRLSVEGSMSQVLDTETRELTVPDLTSPQAMLGTPAIYRARTLRDFQILKTDAAAVPVATREFTRTDRVLVRVPTYGPGDSVPKLAVHLLNRAGQSMSEVPVSPAPKPTEQQWELPLNSLAPGEYLIEIKVSSDAGDAKELLGFRVAG